MSQLRKEERITQNCAPKRIYSSNPESSNCGLGNEDFVDCQISFEKDFEEELHQSLKKLMNDDPNPGIINQAGKANDLGPRMQTNNKSKSKLSNPKHCSNDSNNCAIKTAYPATYSNSRNLIQACPQQFQTHPSLSYANYPQYVCNSYGNLSCYQQYYYLPQQLISTNYNSLIPTVVVPNSNNMTGRIDMGHFKFVGQHQCDLKEKYPKVISNCESIDLVSDFIKKCPSHLDFILNNKIEAEQLLGCINSINSIPLFKCLVNSLQTLILDNFGNYLCQELFKSIPCEYRLYVWNTILEKNIILYGTHQYAHHVIQLLIEVATDENEQVNIINLLKPCFDVLIFDSKGSHVIQKILTCFSFQSKICLLQFILNNLAALISNAQGVCSVKKLIGALEKCAFRNNFYKNILELLPSLSNDKSAHYAFLCLIEDWTPDCYEEILDYLIFNFISLSTQKYSSRLIEKCLILKNKVSFCIIFSIS